MINSYEQPIEMKNIYIRISPPPCHRQDRADRAVIMAADKRTGSTKNNPATDRQTRLNAALRDNLRKRKQQQRARSARSGSDSSIKDKEGPA